MSQVLEQCRTLLVYNRLFCGVIGATVLSLSPSRQSLVRSLSWERILSISDDRYLTDIHSQTCFSSPFSFNISLLLAQINVSIFTSSTFPFHSLWKSEAMFEEYCRECQNCLKESFSSSFFSSSYWLSLFLSFSQAYWWPSQRLFLRRGDVDHNSKATNAIVSERERERRPSNVSWRPLWSWSSLHSSLSLCLCQSPSAGSNNCPARLEASDLSSAFYYVGVAQQ